MKKVFSIWLICLFACVAGQVAAQTYTFSPSGWTSKPVGNISSGSTTYNAATTDGVYISARAVNNGDGTIKIYVKKSNGSFQNSVTARAYKNLTYSGGSITSMGTSAGQGKANSGDSQISFDVTPGITSGSCTYTLLVISNGSTVTRFHTFPITVKASTPAPNLFLASEMSFGGTSLVQNANNSFSVKVKNSGSSSWKGAFYLKCGSTDLITWSKEIAAGSTVTLTGTYAFPTTGSKKVELYYQTGGSGDGHLVPAGSYSNPITVTVSSNQRADLFLASAMSFGGTSLVKDKNNSFSVKVKNSGSSSWKGAFYLKCGSTDLITWSKEIAAGSTVTLTGTYAFPTTGSKKVELYYQTGGSGDGYLVPAGSYSNPITVTVSSPSSSVTSLTLVSAMSFDATNLIVGKQYSFSANVKNTGTSSWTGRFYVKCDGENLIAIEKPRTLSVGDVTLISGTYTPTSTGTKKIELYYKTETESSGVLVSSGSYSNPITVTFSSSQTASANLTLSMAPSFGSTNLTKGKPYNFVTRIKNTGTSSWTGYFFVKPVGTDNNWIRTENPVTINSGKEYSLTGSYTPTATGTYSIGVHYLTKGETSGDLVGKGSYSNPITVTVSSSSSSVTSLTLVSAMSFDATNLIVGKQYSFSANVKNTGTSSWTGRFYVKCDGENLIAIEKPRTLSVGDVTLISGTYTPTSTGTKKIELYYKTETESSGVLVSSGSYSNPITVTFSSSQTASANLTLSMAPSFGSTNLTKGKPYNFVTRIKNTGTTSWTGYFFVKPVGTDNNWIRTENPVTISSGKEYSLTGSYTPTATGTYSIGVHYLTKGETSGDLVSKGSYSNPITISVTESSTPTYSTNLKLKSAITAPSTLTLGSTGNLAATVTNSGNASWSGTLYIFDNGTKVAERTTTISSSGGFSTIYTSSWKPTTAGQHEISVCYLSSNSSSTELVGANGYSNPVFVTVNSPVTTKKANLTLITKGLAPTAVAAGSEVYYHYRITDENYYRLSGVKLVYDIISNFRSGSYISEASDENGLVTLTLATEEGMAGSDVQIVVKSLQDSQGNKVELARSTTDGNITLAVKPIDVFQNVESTKIELEPGVSKEWGLGNFMKVNVGGSIPFTFKRKYNNDGSLKNKTIGIGVKVGGGGKIDVSLDESMGDYKKYFDCLTVGGSVQIGGDVSVSADSYSGAIMCGVLALAEKSPITTNVIVDKGIKVIRKLFEYEFKPTYSSDWFYGFSSNLNVDFMKSQPIASVFHKIFFPKNIEIKELGAGINGSYKLIPIKYNNDTEKGIQTYSRSSSLNLNGYANVKTSFENTFFANKSWWNSGSRIIVQPRLLGPDTFFKLNKSNVSGDIGINIFEEEEYNDFGMTSLKSISNKISLTKGAKISLEGLGLKGICTTLDAEGAYKTTASTKFKSGSNWVNDVMAIAAKNSLQATIIKNVYPILKEKSLFTSPMDLYNIRRNDYLRDLPKVDMSNASYNIKEVLKVEQVNSSEVMLKLKIPIFVWKKFYFELGATVSADCFPSESYFSPEDKTFLPVVARPSSSIVDIASDIVKEIVDKIAKAVKNDEQEINDTWDGITARTQCGSNIGTKIYFTNRGQGHPSILDANGKVCRWAARRHPQLAAAKQDDICTFAFTINDQTQNFDAGVNLAFEHYYPAGDLLAVTEQGDTLFVVSEVCDLSAMVANQNLSASQRGQFKMETAVGADDLTPFGLPKDLKLDVYQADEGSDIWHYVGPAGTTTMVNSLGSYIMATSIKNDVQKPQISITVDNTTGVMRLFIKDNIGLKKNTLQVLINGSLRTLNAIDEWNYALKLSSSDMQGTMTVYVTVDDLAGNNGHVFRIFDMGPTGIVGVEKNDSSEQSSISVRNGAIVVSDSKPDTRVAVFTLDGKLVVEGQTDASGVAVLHQPIKRMGVYVVTLSDGTTQKVYIK